MSAYWGYKTDICVSGDPVQNMGQLINSIKK
jgi:hypothetical protein